MLGEELDRNIKAYLLSLHSCGAVVNTAITLAYPKGIMLNEDANSLDVSGEHISLTKNTGRKFPSQNRLCC